MNSEYHKEKNTSHERMPLQTHLLPHLSYSSHSPNSPIVDRSGTGSLRRQIAMLTQKHGSIRKNGGSFQPLPSPSNGSSMEIEARKYGSQKSLSSFMTYTSSLNMFSEFTMGKFRVFVSQRSNTSSFIIQQSSKAIVSSFIADLTMEWLATLQDSTQTHALQIRDVEFLMNQ